MALLDELKIEKVHLVGNSMGGAIALHLLMDAPDRFERVVHMGPIGTPHKITPALDRLWGFYDDPSVQIFRNLIRWFVYDEAFLADKLDSIAQTRFEAAMNPDVQRSFKAMFPAPRQTAIDDLVVSELALRRMDHPTLLDSWTRRSGSSQWKPVCICWNICRMCSCMSLDNAVIGSRLNTPRVSISCWRNSSADRFKP